MLCLYSALPLVFISSQIPLQVPQDNKYVQSKILEGITLKRQLKVTIHLEKHHNILHALLLSAAQKSV